MTTTFHRDWRDVPAGSWRRPNVSKPKRGQMTCNAGCWKQRLAVLAIATSLLSGCPTVACEPRVATVCAPEVQYSREFQARAAEEPALLPEGPVIPEMLNDYAVMRKQVRMCSRP